MVITFGEGRRAGGNRLLFLTQLLYLLPCGSESKASACNAGDLALIPGSGRSLEKEMATRSSILAWKIPWMVKPGRLQSRGLQRVGHNWVTSLSFHFQLLHQKFLQQKCAGICLYNFFLPFLKDEVLCQWQRRRRWMRTEILWGREIERRRPSPSEQEVMKMQNRQWYLGWWGHRLKREDHAAANFQV